MYGPNERDIRPLEVQPEVPATGSTTRRRRLLWPAAGVVLALTVTGVGLVKGDLRRGPDPAAGSVADGAGPAATAASSAPSGPTAADIARRAALKAARAANWSGDPVQLPGGWVVTGLGRLDEGNGRTTVNTLLSGNVVRQPETGRFTVLRGNYGTVSVAPTSGYAAVSSDHHPYETGIVAPGSTKVRWTRGLGPQWSSDGKRLLLWYSKGFEVVDVATGRVRQHPVNPATYFCTDYCEYTWMPGDREVTLPLTDPLAPRSENAPHPRDSIQVFSAETGQPVRALPVKGTPIGAWCWSPNGKHVLIKAETYEESTRIAEVATGRIVGSVPTKQAYLVGDDRVLGIVGTAAVLYDLTGKAVEQTPLPGNLAVRQLSIAPAA